MPQTSIENSYDPATLRHGLNYYLRPDKSRIYISDVSPEREDFMGRREATARTYMYRILNRPPNPNAMANDGHLNSSVPASYWSLFQHDLAWTTSKRLNVDAMAQASQLLVGLKDFASFRNAKCQSKSSIKHMMDVSIYVNKVRVSGEGGSAAEAAVLTGSPHHPRYLHLLVRHSPHSQCYCLPST